MTTTRLAVAALLLATVAAPPASAPARAEEMAWVPAVPHRVGAAFPGGVAYALPAPSREPCRRANLLTRDDLHSSGTGGGLACGRADPS